MQSCASTSDRQLVQRAIPLGAHLLINYDLPFSKEHHMRRITSILGDLSGPGELMSTIHFVVAGQMAQFRSLEKFTNAAIHEMPVHAADILMAVQ